MDLSDGSDVEGDVEEVDEVALLGSDDEEQYTNTEQHIGEEYFEEHEGEEHNLDGDVLDLELHDDDGLGFGDDAEGSVRKIAPVQVRTSAISSQQSNDNDALPNTASYQHQIPEHYEHNEGYGDDEELDYDEDDDDDVDDSKNTRTRFQNERIAEQISGQNVTCFGKPIQIVGAIKTTEDGNRQRHNWNQRQRFPMPRNPLLLMRPRQHFNQFNRLPRGGPRMNFCFPPMQFQGRMYTNFDQSVPRPPNPHPIREPGGPPIFQGPPEPQPGMMGPGPEAIVGTPPHAQFPNQNPNFNNQMIQNNPRPNMRPQMRVPRMGHPRQQWRGPRPRGIHPQQFSRVPPMNQVIPQQNLQQQNQFMNPGPQMFPQDPNYPHAPPQMYQEQQQMPFNPPYSMGPIPHDTFQQQPHMPGPSTDMPPQMPPQSQPNFFTVQQQQQQQQPQMQNIQIHQNPNFVPHQQQQQQQPQQLVGGWQNVNHDQQQQLSQNSSWYPPPGNLQNFMQPNVDLNLMHGAHINTNFQPPQQQQQQHSQINVLPVPSISVSSESDYKRNISNAEYSSRSRRDDDYLNLDKRSSRERRRSSSSERDYHEVSRRNRDRDYDYEEREYSIRKRKYHESSTEKRFDGRLGPPIPNSPKAASISPVKIDEKAEELLKIREESKKTVGLDDEYIKKLDQQKKLREEILRRKAAARKKLNGPDFCEPDSCESQQETATKQSIYINPKTFKGNLSSLTKLKSNEVAKSTITRTVKSDPVGTTISNKPRKVLKIVKDKYGNIISKSKVIYVPKQQPQDGRTSSA